MTVFTNFPTAPYTFLKLVQKAEGNTIDEEYNTTGIFKLRDGMSNPLNMETPTADATLRVRPGETFLADVNYNMVGHGIRMGRNADQNYRVIGQVEGYDYDADDLDFYLLTLKREDLAIWDESNSPLT